LAEKAVAIGEWDLAREAAGGITDAKEKAWRQGCHPSKILKLKFPHKPSIHLNPVSAFETKS
jgi:hypothetical protein